MKLISQFDYTLYFAISKKLKFNEMKIYKYLNITFKYIKIESTSQNSFNCLFKFLKISFYSIIKVVKTILLSKSFVIENIK